MALASAILAQRRGLRIKPKSPPGFGGQHVAALT